MDKLKYRLFRISSRSSHLNSIKNIFTLITVYVTLTLFDVQIVQNKKKKSDFFFLILNDLHYKPFMWHFNGVQGQIV